MLRLNNPYYTKIWLITQTKYNIRYLFSKYIFVISISCVLLFEKMDREMDFLRIKESTWFSVVGN